MNQQDLFDQFDALDRSMKLLLPQLPPHEADWRPRENMRSIWELANHLAQAPAIGTSIAKGDSESVVQGRESELTRTTVNGLLSVWEEGINELKSYFGALSQEEFETMTTTAFYDYTAPAKTWLLETLTHVHHHRAQLFNYLKESGKDLDGYDYLYV